jgi:cobalt/nickel transport protein
MRNFRGLTLAALILAATPVFGHFNMLFPKAASSKRGSAVEFVYQWGHPFEHQLFDAPQPESLFVLAPGGRKTNLLTTLEKTSVAGSEGKRVNAYRFQFTPEQRGDYIFVLKTPPIWMDEEGEFFQDIVKVVLHVQAQKGWDSSVGEVFEVVPLTRPYGLQPGMVFQAQVESRPPGRESTAPPLTHPIEIERYSPKPPKELPPDEQVTRTARADKNGVVTGTLTDPGWWCLTAARQGGVREHDGKGFPVLQRTTLWVYVDEKPAK